MLSRVTPIQTNGATQELKRSLKRSHLKLGKAPNFLQLMANSHASLWAYILADAALVPGQLAARRREQVALAVAEINGGAYSLSAHYEIGRSLGLTHDQLQLARNAAAADPKAEIMLRFTQAVVLQPGEIKENNSTMNALAQWNAGLWIDHREAIIVLVSKKGQETRRIKSHVEKQLRRSGRSPSKATFEPQMVPADDSRERGYTGHLANFYDEVVSCLRPAKAILLFGPGEAKGELRKRIERDKLDLRITRCETSDKMTERQISQKVRRHYFPSTATSPQAGGASGEHQGLRRR